MSKLVSLVLDFSGAQSQDCGALLLEFPTAQVAVGDAVEIRLWGEPDLLDGWRLLAGTQNLGVGQLTRDKDATPRLAGGHGVGALVEKEFSFESSRSGQFDFPTWRPRASRTRSSPT